MYHQIVNEIINFLNNEKIETVYFKDVLEFNSSDFCELAIRIKDTDLSNWEYFISRVNDCKDILDYTYNNDSLAFRFNPDVNKDSDVLSESLKKILDCLNKRFYLVSPIVKNFSVLIKPTHRCNLDCKYCYDKPFRDTIKEDLTMETLDKFISLLSKYSRTVNIIWHGGEPTMVGMKWYTKVYETIIPKYPMTEFTFSIMTNGVVLNKKWIDFFKEYKTEIGMSYNALCQTSVRCSNQQIYIDEQEDKIDKKLQKIIKDTKVGIIDVISKANYKKQIEIYEFYKKIRCGLSMNHIFHTKQAEENELELPAKEYADEYLKYFKHWLFDKNGMHERSADNMLKLVIGSNNVTCEHKDCRFEWLGLNPIGEIYPCDRYFPEKYKVGSVYDFESIQSIFESEKYNSYRLEIQKRFDTKCKQCGYWFACHGGCNASSIESTGDASGVDEFLCELFRFKFNGVYEILRDIDVVTDESLNPYARKTLCKNGFYSIKEIKDIMSGFGIDVTELKYDPDNLLECEEYSVFRGINYTKDSKEVGRHTDFSYSFTQNSIKHNKKIRRNDLLDYLNNIAHKTSIALENDNYKNTLGVLQNE